MGDNPWRMDGLASVAAIDRAGDYGGYSEFIVNIPMVHKASGAAIVGVSTGTKQHKAEVVASMLNKGFKAAEKTDG